MFVNQSLFYYILFFLCVHYQNLFSFSSEYIFKRLELISCLLKSNERNLYSKHIIFVRFHIFLKTLPY